MDLDAAFRQEQARAFRTSSSVKSAKKEERVMWGLNDPHKFTNCTVSSNP